MRTYQATATLHDNGKLTIELSPDFQEVYRQVEVVVRQNEVDYDPQRLQKWLETYAGSIQGPVTEEHTLHRGELYD